MMRLLLRAEGLPANFTRARLEQFAAEKTLVILKPEPQSLEYFSNVSIAERG